MSIDFKIQNTCDHQINWETASLSVADYKSITTTCFIASGSSVSVRINGTRLDDSQFQVRTRKNSLDPTETEKYIWLVKKERSYEPLIEVRYQTLRTSCPKCLGGAVLDDIKYDTNGDVVTVEKEFQLLQTVEKYIVTKIDSNIFHGWMGTDIHGLLGAKINDIDTLRLELSNQITSAIDKLKDIQSQLINTGRLVNDGEIFNELLGVDINRKDEDPTILEAVVTFTSRAGNVLQFEQLLEFGQLRERVAY